MPPARPDDLQQRIDAVVEAAVEWHQSGREGDNTWFDKAEALGVAIDRLLELREPPTTASTPTESCNWCDHPESYLPPTLMEGKWIHIGRDNDGQLCTAPICVLCSHPWAFSYGEEGSHDNDGRCYFPIGANASGGQRSCYCKCVFPAA